MSSKSSNSASSRATIGRTFRPGPKATQSGFALVRTGRIVSTAWNKGSGFQQHALTAPERPIIHSAMTIVSPVSQIVNTNIQSPSLLRFRHHAVIERPGEKLRKNRDDVKAHNYRRLTSLTHPSSPFRDGSHLDPAVHPDRSPRQIHLHERDQHIAPPVVRHALLPSTAAHRTAAIRSRLPTCLPGAVEYLQPIRSDWKYSPSGNCARSDQRHP